MNQSRAGKPIHKARKTPSITFPSTPPKLSSATEVVYYALNESLLEQATGQLKDQIVTSELHYKPGLLTIARISFVGSRWELHHNRDVVKVILFPPQPQMGDWDDSLIEQWDAHKALSMPQGNALYIYDSSHDFSVARIEELQEEFINHLTSHEVLEVQFNPLLKLDKKVEESDESFQTRCLEQARLQIDLEVKTLEETHQRLQSRLKEKLEREVREIGKDQLEMQSVEDLASQRKDRASTPEERETQMAMRESIATIDDVSKELEDLQILREAKMKEFEENIAGIAKERQKDILRLNRGNVQVLRFAIVWLPYTEFVIQQTDGRSLKLIRSF